MLFFIIDELLNFNSLIHNFFAIAQNLTFDRAEYSNLSYLHAIFQRIFNQENKIKLSDKTIERIVQFQTPDHDLFRIKLDLLLRFFGENVQEYVNYKNLFFKKAIFDGNLIDEKIHINEIAVDDILEKCCSNEY